MQGKTTGRAVGWSTQQSRDERKMGKLSIENGAHRRSLTREVDTAEFFKHIASEGLSEPRRMKQLLTWCGERALNEKPPHGSQGSSAILEVEFTRSEDIERREAEL